MGNIKNIFRKLLLETVEYLNPIKFPTDKYIDLNYDFSGELYVERNTEGTPYMGSMFGQDVEPKGYYCIQRETTMFNNNPNYEFSKVHIKQPIVIQISDETRIKWKYDLSEMFDGLTGNGLTQALKSKGYDSVITVDDKGNSWEIVLFNKPTPQN